MNILSKEDILRNTISPYDQYCSGYSGDGPYLVALVIGQGIFAKTFSHAGSNLLDSIVAYDRAEIAGAYIGQINMITVSSFCGPQGLIWGYDIAKTDCSPISFLSDKDLVPFSGITIKNGASLHNAAKMLFGTNSDRHFPFLPGSHVPCAGKFRYFEGPTVIYSAVAIGIPKNRENDACLFMEDVGEFTLMNGDNSTMQMMRRLTINMIQSVLEVGHNQKVEYKEILVDVNYRTVKSGEIGCALVAAPYFHIARRASSGNLISQDLESWVGEKRNYFLRNYSK